MSASYFIYKKLKNKYIRSLITIIICKKEGGQAYSKTIRKIYREFYGIDIGYGSYGGCFNQHLIRPNVKFGNYCSIAGEVKIFTANHPINLFTTHPITYEPKMGGPKNKIIYNHLEIGHGVWIGVATIICPGVKKIGNGAIIGAGSVVTKDVSPYSIVAGNPAKLIRMRFNNDIINKLEETQWWKLTKDILVKEITHLNKIVGCEI